MLYGNQLTIRYYHTVKQVRSTNKYINIDETECGLRRTLAAVIQNKSYRKLLILIYKRKYWDNLLLRSSIVEFIKTLHTPVKSGKNYTKTTT